MGYVHFVRSPYAHAIIRSVDVSKALEIPGVFGTLTGDEVATLTDPFFQLSTPPGSEIKDYALAVGASASSAIRSRSSSPRRASSRATRPSSSRSTTSRCR